MDSRFRGNDIELGGHTLLFAKHKCGSTKEECPPNSRKINA